MKMGKKIWLYWAPLIIGGFVIGGFCGSDVVPMYMLMVYGGIWGLLYGTFYYQIIEPILKKMEEENESD